MSETEGIIIEGSTASWTINTVGNVLGTYHGQFKFRCMLTPLQQLAAGRAERELIGVNMALASDHERFTAYALTQLKYRIISAPPFWSSSTYGDIQGDLIDSELIAVILSAAIDAESLYRTQIKERKEQAIKRAREVHEKLIKREMDDREDNKLVEES
jgi:hypothetical protein